MAAPTVKELVSFVTSTTADDCGADDMGVLGLQSRLVTLLSDPGQGFPSALMEARHSFAALSGDEAGQALDVMLESLAAHLLYDWAEKVDAFALEDHLFDITEVWGPLVADMYLWGWTVAAYGGLEPWGGVESARVKGWLRFRSPSETLLARGRQGWATFTQHWGVDEGDTAAHIAAVHTHLAARWLQSRAQRSVE